MPSEILNALEAEYARRRQENQRLTLQHQEEAARRSPAVAHLMHEREETLHSALRGILAHEQRYADLPARMEALNRELIRQLRACGLPEDYLEPVYTCPVCRDTGYTGEPVREMCACMRSAYYARLGEAIGLRPDSGQRFELWDDSVFPDDRALPEQPFTQRQQMNLIRQRCEQWASVWPDGQPNLVVLSGPSGLGKTWLMHCMADTLLRRGRTVMLVDAYRLVEESRRAWMNQPSDLESLMAAEVLMVDDLGSEPLMQNVTIEQLYQTISRRQSAGQATVFSTNLGRETLRTRYTERIASRMLDQQGSLFIPLMGEDLRRR